MGHACHARRCAINVKPELLMCFRHWRMVPSDIQSVVWKSYRPGQCDNKRPSEEWHEAADAAIGFIAVREGESVRASEIEALNRFGYRVDLVKHTVELFE
jgi:hypothetical protein